MSIVYVGLDLGSSNFQQVALNHAGVVRVNRDFSTSEANLVKAFSDLKGVRYTCTWKLGNWRPGPPQ